MVYFMMYDNNFKRLCSMLQGWSDGNKIIYNGVNGVEAETRKSQASFQIIRVSSSTKEDQKIDHYQTFML